MKRSAWPASRVAPHIGDARCAEIIGDAADRDHQRVVADRAWRGNLTSFVVESGGEMHLLFGAIEPDHFAEAIAEPVPMRLGEVVHLVFARDRCCPPRPHATVASRDGSGRIPPR